MIINFPSKQDSLLKHDDLISRLLRHFMMITSYYDGIQQISKFCREIPTFSRKFLFKIVFGLSIFHCNQFSNFLLHIVGQS